MQKTIDRFCDTALAIRPNTPEQNLKALHSKFQAIAERDYSNRTDRSGLRQQKFLSYRGSVDQKLGVVRTRNCQSVVRTSDVTSARLNRQTLEMLNSQKEGKEGASASVELSPGAPGRNGNVHTMATPGPVGDYVAAVDDQINPFEMMKESSYGQRRERKLTERKRHSSTFSTYYLNKNAKEVASLISIEDRRQMLMQSKEGLEEDEGLPLEQGQDRLMTLPAKSIIGG